MIGRSVRNACSILLCALLLCSCSSKSGSSSSEEQSKSAAPAAKGVVIRLAGDDWGYPTPYAHYPRGPGSFKMALIFDSLLERGEKGLIPWLAESYEVSPDGRNYFFKVRKGVLWQDGTPLTAEDVRFSFEYGNRHPMVLTMIFNKIESVSVDADQRVRVTVKKPSAAMLYNLGTSRIIPKHIWGTVDRPREFTGPKAVIGSGPYRLTSFSKAQKTYRFEANQDFWGPNPRVAAIEYIPVSEEILAYQKGEIDLTRVPADLLERFKADPAHRLLRGPAFFGYRLIFNPKKAQALGELAVRRAVVHAIDKKELVDKVTRGAAVPGRQAILPLDHTLAVKDVKTYAFDPAEAKRLLAETGYDTVGVDGIRKNQKGERLAYTLLCGSQMRGQPGRISEVRLAEVLRQRLREVGIELKIITKDPKTRDSMVKTEEYQMALIGHGGWGSDPDFLSQRFTDLDPDVNMSPSVSGMKVDDPELHRLFQQQALAFDPMERKVIVAELQSRLAEIVPEIPLFYSTEYSVYRPAKYDGWRFMFDHHSLAHGKLSYLAPVDPKFTANNGKGGQ